jgi:hypothetical protein
MPDLSLNSPERNASWDRSANKKPDRSDRVSERPALVERPELDEMLF